MTSLIPGYEYDIFISYRQKDNKHDGWVTKFVENLKGELEATFKEDVSVYFDENPHDRLQETHNVDKSLEGKLKCLIFIPVLSQTYCDPNSYAWQYEFQAFNKLANEDRFGRDVKLRSGNVASRILPIRIHDLEQEDIKLFEKETGSVLRAIDFIFKTTTGVSRPLLSNEDHPNDNLNKTFYRDQINKVAHAIKEIINGMKIEPVLEVKEKDQPRESIKEVGEDEHRIDLEKPTKAVKSKLLSTFAIVAILIVIGILLYPKIFKRDTLEKLRSSGEKISVAVMPFQNMTNDTIWNVWQNGIQDMLVASLSNSPEELIVRQTGSINDLIQSKGLTNYASMTPALASTISQKLDANIFVYGNIKQAGSTIRVYAQLIDSKTETVFKSFLIEGAAKEENIFQVIDSLSAEVQNFLIISKLIKEENPDVLKLEANTKNPEAFKCVINGDNAFYKNDFPAAINLYSQAITIDSNYIWPAIMISYSYWNQSLYEQGGKWCQKVYEKKDQMPKYLKHYAYVIHALYYETPYESIKYLKQLLEIDDQLPDVYTDIGFDYNRLGQYSRAIPELEKALEIYEKWGTKPIWSINYTNLGDAYHETGQYKKEKKLYEKAEKDFPDDFILIYKQAILALSEGDTIAANKCIKKLKSFSKDYSASEADIATGLANIYSAAGILDKAERYYRQALSFEPENPARINDLAYFLVNKDRNINEGLELADRALGLSPDYYASLHSKGWGLYKQGKYQEALEILQKSWDLRREKAIYNHEAFLHLEAAKKAAAGQKNN
jgi:tetratricopeptide (TPR) repeat protein